MTPSRVQRIPLNQEARAHLELDVSDGDVPAAADRIADWLERTGELHRS